MIRNFANLAAFGLVVTLSATPAFAMDKPPTDPQPFVEQQQRWYQQQRRHQQRRYHQQQRRLGGPTSIPEPGMLGLFALGTIGAVCRAPGPSPQLTICRGVAAKLASYAQRPASPAVTIAAMPALAADEPPHTGRAGTCSMPELDLGARRLRRRRRVACPQPAARASARPRPVIEARGLTAAPASPAGDHGRPLDALEAVIRACRTASPDSSYVAKPAHRGRAKIVQKLGEEAVETGIAAIRDRSRGTDQGSRRPRLPSARAARRCRPGPGRRPCRARPPRGRARDRRKGGTFGLGWGLIFLQSSSPFLNRHLLAQAGIQVMRDIGTTARTPSGEGRTSPPRLRAYVLDSPPARG